MKQERRRVPQQVKEREEEGEEERRKEKEEASDVGQRPKVGDNVQGRKGEERGGKPVQRGFKTNHRMPRAPMHCAQAAPGSQFAVVQGPQHHHAVPQDGQKHAKKGVRERINVG